MDDRSRRDAPDAAPRDTSSTSSVAFPGSNDVHGQPARRPFPPFRRISLPGTPSPFERLSSASVLSFDALPEEPTIEPHNEPPPLPSSSKQRPASFHGPHRPRIRASSSKRRSHIPLPDTDKLAKRQNVIAEIMDTERSYVRGLDLIYDHFLSPLITSLQTKKPILSRNQLTSIFSNFIDIWNFHRTFLAALTSLDLTNPLVSLSSVFQDHFPYLSLYTPFITSFPSSMTALTDLVQSNLSFATFIKTQEADESCRRLSLRAWLLTVVQRCPRYILLVKDLLSCTIPETDEFSSLNDVYALLTKVTLSLNTALQAHNQILTVLAIQRGTPNLPFPLVSPGRFLLRRGTLLQVDREQRVREFLLFNDSLVWLSRGAEREGQWGNARSSIAIPLSPEQPPSTSSIMGLAVWDQQTEVLSAGLGFQSPLRPPLGQRSRSKSEAQLSTGRIETRTPNSNQGDGKWWYRGRIELMDIEVVTSTIPGPGESRRFDVFSPSGSFALYAVSQAERESWTEAIREAKVSMLKDLNMTRPNSTLTSSSSTNHLRRALRAIPYLGDTSESASSSSTQKRQNVEHFVPAIWVPDRKANTCMRCGETFGRLMRRRHHCRLCGRVVCANCSNRTFFVTDDNASTPSRACNLCYEAVFPVLPPSPTIDTTPLPEIVQTGPTHPNPRQTASETAFSPTQWESSRPWSVSLPLPIPSPPRQSASSARMSFPESLEPSDNSAGTTPTFPEERKLSRYRSSQLSTSPSSLFGENPRRKTASPRRFARHPSRNSLPATLLTHQHGLVGNPGAINEQPRSLPKPAWHFPFTPSISLQEASVTVYPTSTHQDGTAATGDEGRDGSQQPLPQDFKGLEKGIAFRKLKSLLRR